MKFSKKPKNIQIAVFDLLNIYGKMIMLSVNADISHSEFFLNQVRKYLDKVGINSREKKIDLLITLQNLPDGVFDQSITQYVGVVCRWLYMELRFNTREIGAFYTFLVRAEAMEYPKTHEWETISLQWGWAKGSARKIRGHYSNLYNAVPPEVLKVVIRMLEIRLGQEKGGEGFKKINAALKLAKKEK